MSQATAIAIPLVFSDDERIIRGIYSEYNLKKDKTLKANVYTLRSEEEGISVVRLNYTTLDECKKFLKSIEKPAVKKNYYGFGLIFAGGIIASSVLPVTTQLHQKRADGMEAHAEIYYLIDGNHYCKHPKGSPMPAEISAVIDELLKRSKSYPDPDTNAENWPGENLTSVDPPLAY